MSRKTVVLGITGCIAAYKAAEIVRLLQKNDIRVKVIMTDHATSFVGVTTFRALTNEAVSTGLFDVASDDPIHHISLAREADALLIAPCTANVMAKLAAGLADDLLTTTALALTVPLILAPAMNVAMYQHPATIYNKDTLINRGVKIIEADRGYLACGDTGEGRLAAPDHIVEEVLRVVNQRRDLAGKKVLITAGPTQEPIDPVRYLSNYSSGKTGYELAKAAKERGAEVALVSGPVALTPPKGVRVVQVITAQEMMDAAQQAFMHTDLAIFAAAVADVRPDTPAEHKLKKEGDAHALHVLELVENPDILASLAAKKTTQVVVGFAAETRNVLAGAYKKLLSKHAHFIVANEVGGGKAFGSDENSVWFVDRNHTEQLPRMSKQMLAHAILNKASEYISLSCEKNF